MTLDLLQAADLDVQIHLPDGLVRVVRQNLIDLTPWHIMTREQARTRLSGLRQRYKAKYVPFARRQDNDDLAVLLPEAPGRVIVIHDFAEEGWQFVAEFPSFWDWLRATVEEMIAFDE